MEFGELAEWVWGRLLDFLPDWLDFIPATWPDWALILAAPIVIVVLIGLALRKIFNTFKESKKGFQVAGRLLQGRSIEDPSPATQEGQVEIQRLLEQGRGENAEMRVQIDAILAAVSPPAGAASLGVETESAKKSAVVKLVTDAAPAAQEATRGLARGDMPTGFDVLEREARSAEAEAVAKWRRLGALATGVDTARARAAYEEAFRLQPDNFWACVQLARLREQTGDTEGAHEVAEVAVRLAREGRELAVAKSELADAQLKLGNLEAARHGYEDAAVALGGLADQNPGSAEAQRDLSVSLESLGDVLVTAGDLSGAPARFEESLKVSERLADQNPGSAEAQRDVIISYAKLGGVFPHQGWWARGLAVCERLAAEDRLAPVDAWMLDDLRKRAAEDI